MSVRRVVPIWSNKKTNRQFAVLPHEITLHMMIQIRCKINQSFRNELPNIQTISLIIQK